MIICVIPLLTGKIVGRLITTSHPLGRLTVCYRRASRLHASGSIDVRGISCVRMLVCCHLAKCTSRINKQSFLQTVDSRVLCENQVKVCKHGSKVSFTTYAISHACILLNTVFYFIRMDFAL